MKFSGFVSILCWFGIIANAQTQWPLRDDGLNSVVQWDHYSFIIKGQRLYIWSGEIHYWRIPVPELWIDVLQKVKAAGFNAISVYGHWGFHSASPNVTDFKSGAHDFTKLFTFAKQLGLYIIWRPGPYVNAETTAGGFAGWATTGAYGALRDNDTRYTDAWTPYMTKMGQIVAQHLVTKGGNVFLYQIENEYGYQWKNVAYRTPNPTAIAYMEILKANARTSGIDIPLTHNNQNIDRKSWSTDYGAGFGGNVDVYAADSYPSCWSCNLKECGSAKEFSVLTYYDSYQSAAPTQPSFLAEFQGGAYSPWGGPEGGCINNTGPNWVNVFFRHNIAQKIIAQNIYMLFGGTNCNAGGLAFPKVGTSYDYSAAIAESRVLGSKYAETKLFGQFIRVARDLTKVDLKGNSTSYATDPTIFASELRNPDTNAGFYVTIHATSESLLQTPFKLHVTTSIGNLTIPQGTNSSIVLNGRESKILVTDFKVGSEKLIYSTAEIFTVSMQDRKPLVFFWLPAGEMGEFLLTGVSKGSWLKKDGCSGVTFSSVAAGMIASWTQGTGSCVLSFNNGYRFVLMDRTLAYDSWVPSTSSNPYTPENSTVVVQGPYLVRTVSMPGTTVSITGDWSKNTTLEVFAPKAMLSVKFNGVSLSVNKTSYGSFVGTLVGAADGGVAAVINTLPSLATWKVTDGLPERLSSYDDSKWIVANHTTTPNPNKPATLPVLYADDYGYHTGNILWRGRFSGAHATGVTLSVMGGLSHGWSAFLNGVFIGSYLGRTAISTSTLTLSFANATLSNTTNVLFIIQDHMGHDEYGDAVLPRGISNATLLISSSPNSTLAFTSWRVAGNAGGEANIDPVRGPFAEGGLHGERQGWHLPNYPDRPLLTWGSSSPSVGLSEAGANFYRTVVNLDLPAGLDVSLALVLSSPVGTTVRAQIYVNGYQFGKYVPRIGNQVVFPVYPGILDYHGPNTLALSLWAQESKGGSVSVSWKVLGAVSSSFDPGFNGTDMSYLRPGYSAVPDRSAYY